MISRINLRIRLRSCLYACVLILPFAVRAEESPPKPETLTLADLQGLVFTHDQVIRSFELEGQVCAVVPDRQLVVLQDDSATAVLKLPVLDAQLQPGDKLLIKGENSSLINGDFGIQIDDAPVVDNDGHHLSLLKSGNVFLQAGFQPIRLAWYNNVRRAILKLEWEGPELQRQPVPNAVLWRGSATSQNPGELSQGLNYTVCNGDGTFLADFERETPLGRGVATNFDVSYSIRPEHTALFFSGYIQTPRAGIYTFYLTSDDGARLQVGESRVSCKRIVLDHASSLKILNLDQPQTATNSSFWVELEGEVTFAAVNQNQQLEIEMAAEGDRFPVTIVGGATLLATNLLHERVRVRGIREFPVGGGKMSRIVVPSPAQLEIQSSDTEDASTKRLLTSVAQVQQLKPDELVRKIPAKIKGVVIGSVNANQNLRVQDSSGGISVHLGTSSGSRQPQVGELVEVEGVTSPGAFAPVILAQKVRRLGNSSMPEPIHPRWDQLLNGTLDCAYVEIEGILIGVAGHELTLLCADGILTVNLEGSRIAGRTNALSCLLPGFASSETSVVGSLVRLRGCYMPYRNMQGRYVVHGKIHLNTPLLMIEQMAPSDPFSLPAKKIADLLWFDPHASALKRTKLNGQVIRVQDGRYMVLQQTRGFRVQTAKPADVQVGDLVEAVGFPKLEGPSPVLHEAQIRKTGHVPLPAPIQISLEQLVDRNLDSTLVQLKARLIGETSSSNRRMLELQAGLYHFQALQNSSPGSPARLPVGSLLSLVGVYAANDRNHGESGYDPFSLLLVDDAGAVTVLERPSWWTVKHTVTLAVILAGGLGLSLAGNLLMRRKVELRTEQLRREIQDRQRVEQDHAIEQERMRVAQDLHDELGAELTTVGLLGELVKSPATPSENKPKYLEQITRSAHSLVTALDEIVWAVNPKHDSVASSANYYAYFAQPFLNAAGIACRLEIAESFCEQQIDPRLRHGIFLAFKEALNNVVRHSGATEAKIKILTADNQLVIEVADNGRGMKATWDQPNSSKDGIAGMRDRIAHFGGTCSITSKVGVGTIVEFRIPLIWSRGDRAPKNRRALANKALEEKP